MYLFFDTETDGLPKDYKAPSTKVSNWPRVIQLAWAVYSSDASLVHSASYLIKQQKPIPESVTNIHGITDQAVKDYGAERVIALRMFERVCKLPRMKFLIAHNISFDYPILSAEYHRYTTDIPYQHLAKICTMKSSTDFCRIPNVKFGGYKWPKLEELHRKLFGTTITSAHNAMIDVLATASCFFELRRLEVIKNV